MPRQSHRLVRECTPAEIHGFFAELIEGRIATTREIEEREGFKQGALSSIAPTFGYFYDKTAPRPNHYPGVTGFGMWYQGKPKPQRQRGKPASPYAPGQVHAHPHPPTPTVAAPTDNVAQVLRAYNEQLLRLEERFDQDQRTIHDLRIAVEGLQQDNARLMEENDKLRAQMNEQQQTRETEEAARQVAETQARIQAKMAIINGQPAPWTTT